MTHESHRPAHGHEHGPGAHPGYEVRDTNVRAIVIFLVALSLFIIVSQVFLWGLLRGMTVTNPEPPVLLAHPEQIRDQMRELREAEDAALAGKAPGAVPIDTAIAKLAEEGIPPGKAGLTEADVNAHSGKAAPQEPTKAP